MPLTVPSNSTKILLIAITATAVVIITIIGLRANLKGVTTVTVTAVIATITIAIIGMLTEFIRAIKPLSLCDHLTKATSD